MIVEHDAAAAIDLQVDEAGSQYHITEIVNRRRASGLTFWRRRLRLCHR